MTLAPYRQTNVVIKTTKGPDAVRSILQADVRQTVARSLLRGDLAKADVSPPKPWEIFGYVEGNRVRLAAATPVRDARTPLFSATIEPDLNGGSIVRAVLRPSAGYRWIGVPGVVGLAIVASSVVVVRLAHGHSPVHPIFFLVVALGFWAGVAIMFLPRVWSDTPDKAAEAVIAWLEKELDGKAAPGDTI
jgi:hypothetical protein